MFVLSPWWKHLGLYWLFPLYINHYTSFIPLYAGSNNQKSKELHMYLIDSLRFWFLFLQLSIRKILKQSSACKVFVWKLMLHKPIWQRGRVNKWQIIYFHSFLLFLNQVFSLRQMNGGWIPLKWLFSIIYFHFTSEKLQTGLYYKTKSQTSHSSFQYNFCNNTYNNNKLH